MLKVICLTKLTSHGLLEFQTVYPGTIMCASCVLKKSPLLHLSDCNLSESTIYAPYKISCVHTLESEAAIVEK